MQAEAGLHVYVCMYVWDFGFLFFFLLFAHVMFFPKHYQHFMVAV